MTLVAVRVTPRSSKDDLVVRADGSVHVRVTAPPDEGKANAAACALLAGALGVPKSAVSVERGRAARQKVLRVAGLTEDDALARLASLREG